MAICCHPLSTSDSACGFLRFGMLIYDARDGCEAASWVRYTVLMDVERIIDEIEQLEEMFEAPDIRPLSASDVAAANRRHDEMLASSPWFRLWQSYGV